MSFNIKIKHVPTGQRIEFKPYLRKFADNYTSDWQQNFVMGRMDQIPTFKRTKRTINIQFDVPSADQTEATLKYNDSRKLVSFLYPVYKTEQIGQQNAKTDIEQSGIPDNVSPATKEYYASLQKSTTLEQQLGLRKDVAIMSSSPLLGIKFSNLIHEKNDYLYGYVDGFNFEPDQEMGFFVTTDMLIPKSFSINFTFNVIHTKPLGWDLNNKNRGNQ